jgi:hypothetical protein
MKLKIGEWTVEGKHGDWIVAKTRHNKKGEETGLGDQHYFGRLYQAMLFIKHHKLQESDASDVQSIIDAIHSEGKAIKEAADTVEETLNKLLQGAE